jgi:hypothetical protein
MSTNIDSVRVIWQAEFRIRGDVLAELIDAFEDKFPEDCFLNDLVPGGDRPWNSEWSPERWYPIVHPNWTGEGSGHTWEILLDKVLPRTMGSADLIFCWEGGSDFSGIRVRDGTVTKHEVIQTLGEQI